MLALPESPVVCEGAAATLLDLPAGESGPILGALAGLGLVQPLAAGHYRCHDLVRRYATERAAATDPPADRAAAMARLLDHYATRAAEAGPPADAGPGEPALTTALGCA